MAERFYFERPSAARKTEIIEYLNEFAAAGSEINGSGSLDRILSGWTFEQALERCLSMENKEYAEKMNRCPGKTFLLIRENDSRIVGTVNVRWDLNEAMLRFGGHIGYGVRPSERRKGYNKINLFLALKEALKPDHFSKDERVESGGLYGITLPDMSLDEIYGMVNDKEEITALDWYDHIKGKEKIALIDEKLLDYYI